MTNHATGTRDEWLAARLELLAAEKELTRHSDELARQRQTLPWVRVEKEYRFQTEEGPASLADLFGGRSQLLVYHFMFGSDYSAGCPACSAIADGFKLNSGVRGSRVRLLALPAPRHNRTKEVCRAMPVSPPGATGSDARYPGRSRAFRGSSATAPGP